MNLEAIREEIRAEIDSLTEECDALQRWLDRQGPASEVEDEEWRWKIYQLESSRDGMLTDIERLQRQLQYVGHERAASSTVTHLLDARGATLCGRMLPVPKPITEPYPCRRCHEEGGGLGEQRQAPFGGGAVHLMIDGETRCGLRPRTEWRAPGEDPPALPKCPRCVNPEHWPERSFRLYALRSTINGREIVKFGEAADVRARVTGIRGAMPEPVELIGSWRTPAGDGPVHTLLLDRCGEVKEFADRQNEAGGRYEWYYRDEEIDHVLALLMADGPGAQRRIAKAAAWIALGRIDAHRLS